MVVPVAVGGVLAVSVILNIILVIIVVVLLIRGKDKRVHLPQSYEVKEQEANEDIEMKPSIVCGLTSERVTTESNDAYGVSQPHNPLAESQYEYVNP